MPLTQLAGTTNPVTLDTSAAGEAYDIDWDFTSEAGFVADGSFVDAGARHRVARGWAGCPGLCESGCFADVHVGRGHGHDGDFFADRGGVDVGPSPQWLTATPDSGTLYVSLVGSMETVALDTETHEIIARIDVGFGPKRNSTHIFQTGQVR